MIIYKVTNKINGKVYIGKITKGLDERKKAHIEQSKNKRSYFYNAIRRYGIDSFFWEVLIECNNQKSLNEHEKFFIAVYRANGNVYNLTDGGEGVPGYKHTDQTKKLIGNKSKKMWGNEDFKKTRSLMYKGNDFFKGRKHSEETKRNFSLARKGKPNNRGYSRKDIDDKKIREYLKQGFSYRKIAEIFNTRHETIRYRMLKDDPDYRKKEKALTSGGMVKSQNTTLIA